MQLDKVLRNGKGQASSFSAAAPASTSISAVLMEKPSKQTGVASAVKDAEDRDHQQAKNIILHSGSTHLVISKACGLVMALLICVCVW